ncbi:MAG: archaemetzincin [Thermodesulfobacteriota bacterium]|nr:archaemetzincin [Thermodesulfobacteriota bacterium]
MSRCITIRPIGSVDQQILDHIAERISLRSGLNCKIGPGTKIPWHTYNKTRRQYNSKLILKYLQKQCTSDMLALMAITQVDLYVPILKYVFGVSQIAGQCSVISLNRLSPEFYNQPSNRDILLERAEKTALHELGHTFGLTHCRDRQCVMHSSYHIEDTDFKQPLFCPTCFELLKWYLKKKPCPAP